MTKPEIPHSPKPDYLDLAAPEAGSGKAIEVGPGVHWLRMPLFGGDFVINCWALEDGAEWAIVDTGLHSDQSEAAWAIAAEELMGARRISRVIATHMHPDHAGMAGWLTRLHGATLHMTRLEYFSLLMFEAGGEAAVVGEREFCRRGGMPEDWLSDFRARSANFAKVISEVPRAYCPMQDGDLISIGGRDWQVVVGHGHSPEHACLWNASDNLLISGDQILPEISSNVSVVAHEPDGDPLSDWIASLERIKTIVPDDVLVLPAHGQPFRGLHNRIDALLAGHERKLDRLTAALGDERGRATDFYPVLFRNVEDTFWSRSLALGEALSHLACLRTRGIAKSSVDQEGVIWWQRA